MPLEPNEIYVPQSADEIRSDMLTEIRLEGSKYLATEIAVQPGTDTYLWATGMANAAFMVHANVSIAAVALFPQDADEEGLERWRVGLGLPSLGASKSSGFVVPTISGTATIPQGTEGTLPNGRRFQVTTGAVAISQGAEVEVESIEGGEDTNAAGNTTVRWVNPPLNVAQEAKVSTGSPLTNGLDAETPERLRTRILNRLQNTPAGGNWGHLREIALNASPGVQDAFVYPALGGPASTKLVVVRDFDIDNNDISRAMTNAGLTVVRNAVHQNMPGEMEIVVETSADSAADVSLEVTIPDAAQSGGSGIGWFDATPWPPLEGGDSGRITVSAVGATNQITVTAVTATSPVAGQTHIAWWSRNDYQFRRYLVTAVTGGTGAWVLTLDTDISDSTGAAPQSGDFVCPWAHSLVEYGQTWVNLMRRLGPGENTADGNRLPRSLRHPYVEDEAASDLTVLQITKFIHGDSTIGIDGHPEVTDAQYAYRSLSAPSVPGSVATAPNVLIPGNFGVYQL